MCTCLQSDTVNHTKLMLGSPALTTWLFFNIFVSNNFFSLFLSSSLPGCSVLTFCICCCCCCCCCWSCCCSSSPCCVSSWPTLVKRLLRKMLKESCSGGWTLICFTTAGWEKSGREVTTGNDLNRELWWLRAGRRKCLEILGKLWSWLRKNPGLLWMIRGRTQRMKINIFMVWDMESDWWSYWRWFTRKIQMIISSQPLPETWPHILRLFWRCSHI